MMAEIVEQKGEQSGNIQNQDLTDI